MPRSAAAHVDLDYCLPLAQIPGLLARLLNEEESVVTAKLIRTKAIMGWAGAVLSRFDGR